MQNRSLQWRHVQLFLSIATTVLLPIHAMANLTGNYMAHTSTWIAYLKITQVNRFFSGYLLTVSADARTITTTRRVNVAGSVNGNVISLNIGGQNSNDIDAQLQNGKIRLSFPANDGHIVQLTFARTTPTEWNQALARFKAKWVSLIVHQQQAAAQRAAKAEAAERRRQADAEQARNVGVLMQDYHNSRKEAIEQADHLAALQSLRVKATERKREITEKAKAEKKHLDEMLETALKKLADSKLPEDQQNQQRTELQNAHNTQSDQLDAQAKTAQDEIDTGLSQLKEQIAMLEEDMRHALERIVPDVEALNLYGEFPADALIVPKRKMGLLGILAQPTAITELPYHGSTQIPSADEETCVAVTAKLGNWYAITTADDEKGWVAADKLRVCISYTVEGTAELAKYQKNLPKLKAELDKRSSGK